MSEADTQRAILSAFESMGVLAWRSNAGKVKVRGGWMMLAPPGTPDVLVIVPPNGRLLGLEVKAPKGATREAQTRWANAATRMGVAVATVRSTEEALAAFAAASERR